MKYYNNDKKDLMRENIVISSNLSEMNRCNEIAIELRILEEKPQDLIELHNNYTYLVDYDRTNFTICGMVNKAITEEDIKQSLIDLSDVSKTAIDFNTECLFWSANRKIVQLSYFLEGDYADWITTPEHIRFLKVILSKEYYPDTVFYYAGQQGYYMFRPKVHYPRTYDEYTQIAK